MWRSSARTVFLLVTISASSAEGIPWNEEQRLVSELLVSAQYDVRTRPVKNVSKPVMVSLQVDVFVAQRLVSVLRTILNPSKSISMQQKGAPIVGL